MSCKYTLTSFSLPKLCTIFLLIFCFIVVDIGPVKQKLFGIIVHCQDVNKLRPPGTTIELYHNSLLHSQQNWHMAVNKNTWNEYNHVSKYGIFRPYVLSLVNDIPWGILTKANGKMNVISKLINNFYILKKKTFPGNSEFYFTY